VTDTAAELAQAIALHRSGRFDAAAALYERALQAAPADFEALFYLSQVRTAQGRIDEALSLAQMSVAQHPESAAAQAHLGALLAMRGDHQQALLHLDASLAMRPENPDALSNRGASLHKLGDVRGALEAYRSALILQPENLEITLNAAEVLRELGESAQAAALYRRVLARDPDHVGAHCGLGAALVNLGLLEEAFSELERAAELRPDSPGAYCRLADARRVEPGDPLIERLERFLAGARAEGNADSEIILEYTLAKVYADIGAYDESFAHLAAGSARRRCELEYDEAATLESLAATARTFDRAFVHARRGWGDPSALPVFIVGLPRSGTTLIEQILASHPKVHAAGELTNFVRAAERVLAPESSAGITAGAMCAATQAHVREIGARYAASVRALDPSALRITDKMPANASYTGLIHLALPGARIIHARRDPLDTCFSCFSLNFASGQEFTYDLGELGRYYRAYERLMQHWHDVLPPGTILDVQYEEVVDNFETQARRIVGFCGLEWDDACLRFYENKRPVQTASVLQVRRPIYSSSIGRWRPYAKHLGPLVTALGLSLDLAAPQGRD
jgi:tetratricopeptide (TPR) repeat protein